MSTAVATTIPVIKGTELARSAQQLFESSGSTLEDAILGAWEDLRATGHTECPVCRAAMKPAGCTGCGSELC